MRLYFLVMYNLSGIQKGIQAGHAALEYAEKYFDTEDYREFIENNKTFILLDGGGSVEMESYHAMFHEHGFKYAAFREPDLNMSVSALAFLVPARIYENKEPSDKLVNYPIGSDDWWVNFLRGHNLAKN